MSQSQGNNGENVHIPGISYPLHWHNNPASWSLNADGTLSISSGPKADWFIDPNSGNTTHSAPALLFPAQGTCQLSAFTTVDHAATFDAGALAIYQSPQIWAKLALERSPQGHLMIVSVVTRGESDDCNSITVEGQSIYLRLSKLERAYAFHYSHDGLLWHLVRHFALGSAEGDKIGFLAQSPTGEGCNVHFGSINYSQHKLADIRSGV